MKKIKQQNNKISNNDSYAKEWMKKIKIVTVAKYLKMEDQVEMQ